MLTQTHQKFRLVLVVSDIVGLLGTWLLAFYLRFHTSIIPVTKGIPKLEQYAALAVPILFVWLAMLSATGAYREGVIMQRTRIARRVFRAHVTAFLLFMGLTYLLSEYRFSRVTLLYFGVLSGIYLLGSRLSFRSLLRAIYAREKSRRRVAIVGHGASARAIAQRILRHPELGMSLVGSFRPDSRDNSDEKDLGPRLGDYSAVAAMIAKHGIDSIVLALPRSESDRQDAILRALETMAVDVQFVPDVQEFLVLGCQVGDFEGFPILALNQSPLSYGGLLLKRSLDIVLSATALVILSPLLLVLALLVKLSSRGPVFYGQERMGLDGTTFKMWKFRSMRVDAEKETGPVWAKPGDDRRTALGSFLRATSLDEIPQLWNILKGDMSLVGPRPERPEFVDQFRQNIPAYMFRHKVKAGLTGWAQVNGWRGDTSLEKRIEYDLYYIRHWTFAFDFKILFLTLVRGIIHKNAY